MIERFFSYFQVPDWTRHLSTTKVVKGRSSTVLAEITNYTATLPVFTHNKSNQHLDTNQMGFQCLRSAMIQRIQPRVPITCLTGRVKIGILVSTKKLIIHARSY